MIRSALDRYIAALSALPPKAIDIAVLSTACIMLALENVFVDQESDPVPELVASLNRQTEFLSDALNLSAHMVEPEASQSTSIDVGELFVAAWTTYTPKTYDHSTSLIVDRFRRSGLDEAFFAGKRCLDGGCGTGRLSIAASSMGASEVVALDIGTQSLRFLQEQAQRLGVSTIKTFEGDATKLNFPDKSFDFVASYGVLHHTPDCLGGVREHFRVLKPGGTLWLYLYGDGGLYWPAYDAMRSVVSNFAIADVKRSLQNLKLREGLVYTYLDNVLAPRTYHTESEIVALLRQDDPTLTFRRAIGGSVIDDVSKSLATKYGSLIAGPEGEVRIIITKSSGH